jgi:hypothetical protein
VRLDPLRDRTRQHPQNQTRHPSRWGGPPGHTPARGLTVRCLQRRVTAPCPQGLGITGAPMWNAPRIVCTDCSTSCGQPVGKLGHQASDLQQHAPPAVGERKFRDDFFTRLSRFVHLGLLVDFWRSNPDSHRSDLVTHRSVLTSHVRHNTVWCSLPAIVCRR